MGARMPGTPLAPAPCTRWTPPSPAARSRGALGWARRTAPRSESSSSAALLGRVVQGPDHDGETAYVAAERWLGPLLPSFDPWLLGWRGRGHAVRARHARAVLPGGGILKPVLAVDGRVLGLWSTRRRASRLELALAPFGRLPRAVREGVEAEAADLGRFLGTRVQVVPD
jgi:Winged helix DNA-binding domain